jgi:S-adenosylmethionine:tRNA ribosyltransferase-isomerase
MEILIKDFTYDLPDHRIANIPLRERDASKLLVYRDGQIVDDRFSNLASQLPSGSLLVLNNSRVIHARIFFQKASGGLIEIFCLEPFQPATAELAMNATSVVQWRCLIGGASKWKHGLVLEKNISIEGREIKLSARWIAKETEDFIIEFSWETELPFAAVLEAAGKVPLPPYIKREVNAEDQERYQTVFAENQGSVAAPTASLHFTEKIFDQLAEKNIEKTFLSLHVGAGTFKPVKSETISGHHMHAESFSVNRETLLKLEKNTEIIAGGTTALRALESLYWLALKLESGDEGFHLSQWEAYELDDEELSYRECIQLLITYLDKKGENSLQCKTSLLIKPGYTFRSSKALITNFHQPGSTLLLLVAAFVGQDWKKIYQHALNNDYRFLSYGDASLLWRNNY